MVLQCSLSAVVDNSPSAALWFDHQSRPTKSRDGREEEEELSGHAGCRLSVTVTLRGVCPEGETCSHLARPSLLHIILGQGQHAGFETNHSRRRQLRRTARSEWMALSTQEVVAILLCHLCDHPHSLTCTCHGVRDGPGPAQPRLRGNFLCRRDWIQLREAARSEWAILPAPEVAAHPWCAVCKTHVEWSSDSVSDSLSACCDLKGLEPSPLLQHSITSQSTGCFHSLCPVHYRTLGVCPQRFGSGTSRRS